jgi:ubiquinone/menaquinone biosynthesis C-methylase UbiE
MSHPLALGGAGALRHRDDLRQRQAIGSADVPQVAYGAEADLYDARTGVFQRHRDRLVAALDTRPGDVVLDVGCGTGLCFDGLRRGVGRGGRVVGIDESVDMVRLARERAAGRGWANVSVLNSPVGGAEIPVVADRALFCTVHDILQSFDALRNVFAHLRPGARVVAGGGKFTSSWLFAVNLQMKAMHGPYVRSFEGFERPWAVLAPFLDDFQVTEFALGAGYCAVGRARKILPERPSGQW